MAAATTVIAAAGLAIGAAGAYQQYNATQNASQASQKAENLRKKQMNLDATRKRREVIRQMLYNNAVARANAATQGVSQGDSAVQGSIGQQVNTAGQNLTTVNQSQQIGSGIFSANAQYAQAQQGIAWGEAIQSVGGGIVQNAATISRVGSSAGLWKSDTDTP